MILRFVIFWLIFHLIQRASFPYAQWLSSIIQCTQILHDFWMIFWFWVCGWLLIVTKETAACELWEIHSRLLMTNHLLDNFEQLRVLSKLKRKWKMALFAIQENAPFAEQNDSQRDLDKAELVEESLSRGLEVEHF